MGRALPDPKEVTRTLSVLVGRPVTVAQVRAVYKPSNIEPVHFAVYRSLDGVAEVVCMADMNFASTAAAALSMFPVQRAQECIRARKLDEQLYENFGEVMNVISTLLSTEEVRTRLDTVLAGTKKLAPDAAEILKQPATRLDLEVTISGYIKGKLTFLAAALPEPVLDIEG